MGMCLVLKFPNYVLRCQGAFANPQGHTAYFKILGKIETTVRHYINYLSFSTLLLNKTEQLGISFVLQVPWKNYWASDGAWIQEILETFGLV